VVLFFLKNQDSPLEQVIFISSKKYPGYPDTWVLLRALPLLLLCNFEQVICVLVFCGLVCGFKFTHNNGFGCTWNLQ